MRNKFVLVHCDIYGFHHCDLRYLYTVMTIIEIRFGHVLLGMCFDQLSLWSAIIRRIVPKIGLLGLLMSYLSRIRHG